ncbi:hypothetical protein AG4045_009867 [Apium graveolens]|uniref:RecQ-mediated genome instability protein 1 n=1 Tax=Apium graveolens TaxID=4045 RepID=A0A6L5B846_APIGR|nr:hypothetical protein AG4045_009867 [Apium graveolens]
MTPLRRRHLRMVSSSSDEDENLPPPQPPPPHHQDDESDTNNISIELQTSTINFESVNLSSTNPNPNLPQPITVDVSDDDEFIDVSDNLSPPSPPAQNDSTPVEVFDCAISVFLGGLGLRVKREWLDSCIRALESAVSGFSRLDDVAKGKLCLEQVDEIVNISRPLKGRYQNASSGHKRCLKLSMTDGVQRVFGMEYRPIKNLEVLAPAGMKVVVCNVNVRHGILMLVPEVLEVLGGQVEELDAARQRLAQEVNKPARGKRTKSGVVHPLEARATRAAWPPPNGFNAPTQTNIPTPHNARPFQEDAQAFVIADTTPNNVSINQQTRTESTFPNLQPPHEASINLQSGEVSNRSNNVFINQQTREGSTFRNQQQHHEASINQQTGEESNKPNNVFINQRTREESTFPNQRQHHKASINQQTREESTAPVQMQHHEANTSSTVFSSLDDIQMVEVEHLPILTGDEEIPFTYLANLSTKWAAMRGQVPNVEGKIKCFMTAVKSFQFRNRAKYELHAYVDDGSLISEILISHDVVQQGIGHSPEEVNAAYRSPDQKIVNEMKDTLLQFQNFLFNFEGTMVVHISEASPLPVAIKLNQGCSASDAWGLFRRLRSPRSVHQPDAINISP